MNQTSFPLQVLDCWHKVEFFESTDIQGLHKQGKGAISYRLSELIDDPSCLPWLNHERIRRAGPSYSPAKPYCYSLYLGIFDRSEIFKTAQQYFPQKGKENDERLDNEGLTCSLKLSVFPDGQLDPESLTCSTVTWALGQLKDHRLETIKLEEYEAATQRLQERLLEIVAVADNIKHEHQLPTVLSTFEILEFLKAMEEWTSFKPTHFDAHPALLIQLMEPEQKNPEKSPTTISLPQWLALKQLPIKILAILPESESKHQFPPRPSSGSTNTPEEVSILNSFYLRDIERVRADIVENGLVKESPLGRYLSEDVPHQPDLLTAQGETVLRNGLRLARLPLGRWPSDDSHAMSLMQQFAINTITHDLRNTGLYSVNGPPGTGKTTMLRDLIANNLVARAQVLADLVTPTSAFGPDLTFNHDGNAKTIKTLRPELTGFEMVVVSSNNAAVENISKELPQIKSLGEAYRHSTYLKPVAQKLAAKHTYYPKGTQGKLGIVTPLSHKEDCWGLIAATLGKYKNRHRFGEQVVFKSIDKLDSSGEALHYRTLFHALRALANNQKPLQSFTRAQGTFCSARTQVEKIQKALCRLEALNDLHTTCQAQQRLIERTTLRLARLDARLALCRSRLPDWWKGQFKRRCRGKAIIRGLAQRQELVAKQLAVTQLQHREHQHRLAAEQRECAPLQALYEDAEFAHALTDFEAATVQRKAFGQCLALNQARAQLTVAALELHQAWLVAAYSDLNKSLYLLMDAINGKIEDKNAAKALWQLLFMVVPLVSSTFASVARQFAALDAGDIGWLFIDEAGQANPQQAVGALWRAKRAVVVGDPLQIEPVFTIPPAFVEMVAKQRLGERWIHWSPGSTSVQLLADKSNPYGTQQINQNLWLGSPLRVHRRCDDPMFSIANHIAYSNKMIHGSDHPHDPTEFIWGPSSWHDIRGSVEGKHFVPQQASYVLNMLEGYLREYKALPDVYIITPFKQIKTELQSYLKEALSTKVSNTPKQEAQLQELITRRIGTVHTFQGQEEKNVILVLGLSTESPGAANWASSKPNLLNVAVTRAQKRVYIVGCKETWGSLPFFSDALTALETKQPAQGFQVVPPRVPLYASSKGYELH
ncbi:DEAD/DEAH box helicase [Aeromonas caviae]|uniref:DEAD/DEAH box helicase n=1 Tax=Aeromonas caviae TaxID=648 RepID=UPI002B4971FB|nr:DEAD/DEAH box helicase [Aeromonas caviae]